MLEGLDEIAWHRLTHAYGIATDVPKLLRGVASPTAATRDASISALFGNIWHQGTVYDATPHAVPFLLQLLDVPQCRDNRTELLTLLFLISIGSGYLEVHNPSARGEVEKERVWVNAAHSAVRRGLPTFHALLKDEDPWIRRIVAAILATCPEAAQELRPWLVKAIESEADGEVRCIFGLALAFLGDLQPDAFSRSDGLSADVLRRVAERVASGQVDLTSALNMLGDVAFGETTTERLNDWLKE